MCFFGIKWLWLEGKELLCLRTLGEEGVMYYIKRGPIRSNGWGVLDPRIRKGKEEGETER